MKFETEIDKTYHKIVSGLRYGEQVEVPTSIKSKDDEKEIVKAIAKSALYNNITLHHRWSKDKKFITIKVEFV